MIRSCSVKRIFVMILSLALLLTAISSSFGRLQVYGAANASYTKEELTALAKGIVARQVSTEGLAENSDFISASLTKNPGSTESDWFVIAMAQMGLPGDYGRYLSALSTAIQTRYQSSQKLSASKATEWHRITLAVLACGGDPTAIGGSIDLIADGTYNRGLTKPLDNQGNNGPIYALLALDAMNYTVPSDAYESRADILQRVLDSQLPDGGFCQAGSASDVDITAMALTALAPYAGSYPEVIKKGIALLSAKQSSNGGFSSGGVENAESTAQVIIALTSLGINPQTDSRFIKDGNSPVSALIGYVTESGGIRHTADSAENEMAAQQALCAIAALVRQMNGQTGLYRFTSGTPSLGSNDKTDGASPSEAGATTAVSESEEEQGASEAVNQAVATQSAMSVESMPDSKSESNTAGRTFKNSGVAIIFVSLSVLCFLFGFKMLKGRNRDKLLLLGLALALAAIFFLARPETVGAHYNKENSLDSGKTVTLSINCATIYNHLDDLDESLKNSGYLPENGVILDETEYSIESGDTVFDVLSLAVLENHIQMDYEGGDQNAYDTVYVTGIQYLYEFSCGELSGWTYAVNGDFPDVGSSSCTVADGDVIEWLYTCDLGRDVGDQSVEDMQ